MKLLALALVAALSTCAPAMAQNYTTEELLGRRMATQGICKAQKEVMLALAVPYHADIWDEEELLGLAHMMWYAWGDQYKHLMIKILKEEDYNMTIDEWYSRCIEGANNIGKDPA